MKGQRRQDAVCLAVIAVLAVGFLWPVTLGGKVMAPGDMLLLADPWAAHAREFPEFSQVRNPILDAINQFYPWRSYAREQVLRDTVPLWNPHQWCGTLFVANNSSAIFYPETWLHYVMPTERALGWASALFLFLAGAFMFGFLRTIGLRPVAGLFGAVAFMANGFFVGWLCFASLRSVFAWAPAVLMASERALARRSVPWAAAVAAFFGLQFLAGHLHISLYLVTTVGLYLIWRLATLWRAGEKMRARWGLVALGLALVVGACLATCQLLPTIEAAGMTPRTTSYQAQFSFRLPPSFVVLGAMPDLFGNPVDGNHWGQMLTEQRRVYTETSWYVGVATWLMAILALAWRRRDQTWFWLAIFALAWLLAIGSGLNALFYHLVPGYKWLPGIGRAIVMAATAMSVLAAIGLDAVIEAVDRGAKRRVLATCLAATGGLLVAGALAVTLTSDTIAGAGIGQVVSGIAAYTGAQWWRFVGLLLVATVLVLLMPLKRVSGLMAWALVGLLAFDMYLFIHHFTPAVSPAYVNIKTDVIPLLKEGDQPHRFLSLASGTEPARALQRLPANQATRLGLEDIEGSDSLYIGRYANLLVRITGTSLGAKQPDWRLPLMDLMGVRDAICREELAPPPGWSKLAGQREVNVYRNSRSLPRAYLPGRVTEVANPDEALTRVSGQAFRPADEALLAASDRGALEGTGPQSAAVLRVERYDVNRLTVVADKPWSGLAVVSNVYYPGWHAFSEGKELTLVPVDYAFTGVAGQNVRRFELIYLPESFKLGGFLGCLAAALIVGALVARRGRGGE